MIQLEMPLRRQRAHSRCGVTAGAHTGAHFLHFSLSVELRENAKDLKQ
jgi:hypothetical protein